MKKNVFLRTALFALLSTALLSCGDDDNEPVAVDTPPVVVDDEPPVEEEAITLAEAEALVNAVYGPLQTLSSSYSFLLESATEAAISFEEVDDSKDGPQVSVFETTPSNWYPIKVFNRLYKSIGAANLAIENISASGTNSGFTAADKALLTARAKFIRGYDYFQLVQLFGETPLILSSGSTETARASIDAVYEQVVKDLIEALPDLPAFDANKANPSQGAANTILAKAYLTWGQSPLTSAEIEGIAGTNDPAKPAPDTEKLQKAVAYANDVINSGNYRLLDDYNAIWGVANENNAEVIFSIHHEGDGIDAQGNHQTHCGFTWPKSARTDPHISYADITLENRIPSDNDSRKLFSYATRVEYTDGVVDTLTWPISIVRPGKWIHRTTDGTYRAVDEQPNNIDHIDFRYAEVLLIKAEALFFLNRASEALPLVNEIRERAFASHYAQGGALTLAFTKEDLYNEWNYEFAFEQKHWLNLVRWRTLLSQVKNTVPGYEYYKPAYESAASIKAAFPDIADKINAPFYARVYKHLHAKADNLHGKFYRFPIPLSEDYTDLGIRPQNPGY